MQFSFRKPHFWHPPNFAKTLFWHTVALFVFLKMPPKHYKNGGKQWKNNLDHLSTLNLDHFVTLKPPNLGPLFNFTAYIYTIIYIYIYTSIFSSSGGCPCENRQRFFFFPRAGVHTLTKIRPEVVTSNTASGACFQDSSLQFAGMILSMHYLWENNNALAVAWSTTFLTLACTKSMEFAVFWHLRAHHLGRTDHFSTCSCKLPGNLVVALKPLKLQHSNPMYADNPWKLQHAAPSLYQPMAQNHTSSASLDRRNQQDHPPIKNKNK